MEVSFCLGERGTAKGFFSSGIQGTRTVPDETGSEVIGGVAVSKHHIQANLKLRFGSIRFEITVGRHPLSAVPQLMTISGDLSLAYAQTARSDL
jgi:hypothetical protein